MQKLMTCVLALMLICFSGCSSVKNKNTPEGGFMQNDPSRTGASGNYFAREREKRRQYERELRDTRRPVNQDHFKVMPWHGKSYTPRSETLHEASRESDGSLFH